MRVPNVCRTRRSRSDVFEPSSKFAERRRVDNETMNSRQHAFTHFVPVRAKRVTMIPEVATWTNESRIFQLESVT